MLGLPGPVVPESNGDSLQPVSPGSIETRLQIAKLVTAEGQEYRNDMFLICTLVKPITCQEIRQHCRYQICLRKRRIHNTVSESWGLGTWYLRSCSACPP